jgi:threonine/homoserine/homoserine lactone efflux protein
VTGIWAFLAFAVVLSISPGPDDVLVLRSALAGGCRRGMVTVAGVAAGSAVWGIATAVGLAAAVVPSSPVYEALRLSGAGYLVLLGAGPALASRCRQARRAAPSPPEATERPSAPGGAGSAFWVGLLSDLLSPKIGLFYVAVLPQFVPGGTAALPYSLLLCAIDIGVAVTWLTALAWVADAAVGWLVRPRVVLWSQRVVSTFLIGLGVSTAVGL